MSAGDSEGARGGGDRGAEGEGNLSHSPSGWKLRGEGGGGYPRSKFFYFHAFFWLKFYETIIFCPKLRNFALLPASRKSWIRHFTSRHRRKSEGCNLLLRDKMIPKQALKLLLVISVDFSLFFKMKKISSN